MVKDAGILEATSTMDGGKGSASVSGSGNGNGSSALAGLLYRCVRSISARSALTSTVGLAFVTIVGFRNDNPKQVST